MMNIPYHSIPMRTNCAGMAREAQKRTRRSARRVGMTERNSLKARKLRNAKKTSETVLWRIRARPKTAAMFHQERIRSARFARSARGLSRLRTWTAAVAATRRAKTPPRAHRSRAGTSGRITAAPRGARPGPG
jgi:hypothetical protein